MVPLKKILVYVRKALVRDAPQTEYVDGVNEVAITPVQSNTLRDQGEAPVHQDQFDPSLNAACREKAGCDFGALVCAYMEYAAFSGWNTEKSLAIDKCKTWVTHSMGPAGDALEWKETGVDPLAHWKSDRKLLTHRIENMALSDVANALDAGESPNQSDVNGVTPLIMAAQRCSDLHVLRLLIERGADVNAKDIGGQTALHRAVTRGFDTLACVQLLVNAGARVDVEDNANASPLSLAIAARCDEATAFLEEMGSGLQPKPGVATPLHYAARYNPEQILHLIKRGADPNAYDANGRTPLYWAMWSKTPQDMVRAIRLMAQGGADLEWSSSGKETPLVYALKNSGVPAEVVDCLIQLGANIKTTNRFGTTPLHFAAKHSVNSEMIKVLLRHGADTENVADRAGKTPKDYLAKRSLFPWPTVKGGSTPP